MNAVDILKRFDTFLTRSEVEVKLATMKLANGTVLEADEFSEGNSVFIVTEDERVPLPVGEYEMEDGRVLVVGEIGKIGKVGLETTEEEEKVEEELETIPEAEEEGYKDGIADSKEDIKEDVEDTDLGYVSKQEFEDAVNEIKEMVSKVEARLNEGKEEDDAFVVKEELRENDLEETKLFKHNPNRTEVNKVKFKLGSNRSLSTMDKIMERISNI
jgi:hypothetical protein|tara:strand:+ start:5449 stop:6093 length:645 start_codon:yes stop_codon:yes gene_type:complete